MEKEKINRYNYSFAYKKNEQEKNYEKFSRTFNIIFFAHSVVVATDFRNSQYVKANACIHRSQRVRMVIDKW